MANPLICVFNPVTSFIDEVQSVSTGPAAIGVPIVTNVAGLIDSSLIGSGLANVTAGETTSGGNLVSLYSVGGVLKMELAWAGTGGTGPSGQAYPISANGFVILGTTVNGTGIVQFSGIFTYIDNNSEFGPGDVGAEVYLSALNGNKGGITKTRPSGIGQLQQTVGQVINFTSPNIVQVSFVPVPNPPLLNFSNISTGTNTAATMTVGTGATLTLTGGGIINANQLTSDPVNTSGRTTGQALVFNGTTWVPSSAPATTFSAITSGTNTTATMTVGGGASLTFSGGTINANQIVGITISGTPPTVGQVLTATSPTAANWQTPSGSPGGPNTAIQFNNSGAFGGSANFEWNNGSQFLIVNGDSAFGSSATPGQINAITTSATFDAPTVAGGFSLFDVATIVTTVPGAPVPFAVGQSIGLRANPSATAAGASYVGSLIGVDVPNTNTQPFGGVNGVEATVTYASTGNAGLISAGVFAVNYDSASGTTGIAACNAGIEINGGGGISTTAYSVTAETFHNGTGLVAQMGGYGGQSIVAGTGNATDNMGIQMQTGVQGSSGNITNDYSIFVDSPTFFGATGTLSHHYGLFISDQANGGAQNPDPFAIRVKGNGTTGLTAPVLIGDGTTDLLDYGVANYVSPTQDSPNGSYAGFDSSIQMTMSAPSANSWYGHRTFVQANGTQSYGNLEAFNCAVECASSGGVDTMFGVSILVQNTAGNVGTSAVAVFGQIDVVGTSPLVKGGAFAVNAAGTTTDLRGFDSAVGVGAAATVTNAAGVYINSPSITTGTVTHLYGLYIADQTGGTNNQDPWAIKVAGGVSGFTGIATNIVTKTTTYTATHEDHTINCNGTFTLTLPTTGIKVGQEFYIKNIGVGTITVSSSVNIDGALTAILNTQYESITVQWDGTQYWIY